MVFAVIIAFVWSIGLVLSFSQTRCLVTVDMGPGLALRERSRDILRFQKLR